ncbi:MAG TPA: VOC family protein [Chloroflexota bacterium]|nr:VOC family protein [Chloroflexota bacterium]
MADQTQCPPALPELVPALSVRDPGASLAWFAKLGFQAVETVSLPDGVVGHARLARRGAQLMLGPSCQPELGVHSLALYVSLQDECVDDLYAQAQQAGVVIVQPPRDQFWGDRTFEVQHPDGYRIVFAQHVRDVPAAELEEAVARFAAERSA